jgi:hypothetical protein
MKKQNAKTVYLLMFGLILLIGSAVPTLAQNKYKKGDEVIVDLYGNGKEVVNAVIEEVYNYTAQTSYSVRYTDRYGNSQSAYLEESKIRPRGGTLTSDTSSVNSNPNSNNEIKRKPVTKRDDDEDNYATKTNVSAEDLDWFFGKWKLSRWGGGATVERDDYIYREYLLHVAKAAPITINSDGTYSWIVRDGSTLKGKWRKLTAKEDVVAGGKNGLVLLKGFDGVDWNVSFNGIRSGKEYIKIYSHLGNFDGERAGANKGEPEWNKVQFAKGDLVTVEYGGEQCKGEIDKPFRDNTGTITYFVFITCRTGGRQSVGFIPPSRIRRR